MSVKLLSWVLEEVPQKHPTLDPTARLILLILADHFNDQEGAAWPSHGRVAKMAGVTEETVRRHLRKMEEMGLVSSKPRDGRSNLYVIPPTPMSGVQEAPSTPARGTPLMGEGVPPTPARGVSPIYSTLTEPLKNQPSVRKINPQPYSGEPLPPEEQLRRAKVIREMLKKGVKEDEEVDFDTYFVGSVVGTQSSESNTGR
jgi:DNA-binding transcriptional ArsR family regulator